MRHTLFALALLVALPLYAQNKTISASKSKVTFNITNAGLNVEGSFAKISGSMNFDAANLSGSSVEANIDVSTINTGIDMRDKHLKEEDYFEVSKYPTMKFVSSSFAQSGSGYSVTGQLTIKDVTKTVTVPFTASSSGTSTTLKGTFEIDRRDYHVGGNSWIMGDDVEIILEVVAE